MGNEAPNLELVQVPHREGAQPFDHECKGYAFNWLKYRSDPDKTIYYKVLLDGAEVARIETDEKVYLERYGDAARFEGTALEIQNFDVHEDYRRQGIGRAAVERLAQMFPDCRLVALSQDDDSDKFWGVGMGWKRYNHKDDDGRGPSSRPAYIQSENTA